MSLPDSIRDKLRKIAALAERGEAGEQDAARAMLERLCREHDLEPADLLSEEPTWHEFTFRTERDRRLLTQVAVHILDTYRITNAREKGRVLFKLTAAQAIDVRAAWDHYRNAWRKHQDEALTVFVNANRLFPTRDDSDTPASELTNEAAARLRRIAQLALLTNPSPFRRGIDSKE